MNTKVNTFEKKLSVLSILFITVILFSSGKMHGQSKHELSLHLKGPFSTLIYEHSQDEQSLENGLGVGLNYSYYFSKNWSLATGVEFQSFQGSVHYDVIKDAYHTVDIEGEEFEFRYELRNFSEEQSAYYVNIPVRIQFETEGQRRFYAAGGAKVGFNLKSDYHSDASSLSTSGYYEQYDAELTSPEFMGFGQFEGIGNEEKTLDLKTNFMIDLESGVKFLLDKDRAFYMGLFIDYGLNDITGGQGKDLVVYNTEDPTRFRASSVLESTNKNTSQDYTSKVSTLAFGLKVRYAFGL